MYFLRHKLLFLPFLIAIVGLSMFDGSPKTNVVSAAHADTLAVVELYTSQSCSSCPPADALLGELVTANPNLIAFSCHVTYWDHLNWRDTLSREFCTNRQRAYAKHLADPRVYTPQRVVNGAQGFVGSDRGEAYARIAESAVLPIGLSLTEEGLGAQMPDLSPTAPKQTLWLLSFNASHTQAIRSGENRGRTITYTNSVETLEQVGVWNGTAQTLSFPRPQSEADTPGYILLAQPRGFGPISAAGKLVSTP